MNSDDPAERIHAEIRDKLRTYSVLVFDVYRNRKSPIYLGAATCVATKGRTCLLTAAHVWNEIKGNIGLSLKSDCNLYEIPRDLVTPLIRFENGPNEWGPDPALIVLDELYASMIRREKAFYNFDKQWTKSSLVPGQQKLWSIIGAPAEQSTFNPNEAELLFDLFISSIANAFERDGFDYIDVFFDREQYPDLPRSYGGISGSGLWKILIRRSANDPISSVQLEGVAFFHNATSKKQDVIRCH